MVFFFSPRRSRIWKDMSLNDSLSEVERAKLAVWDYPVSDKYTKMWQAMKEAKLPNTLEEAIERVKSSKSSSEGFAYLGNNKRRIFIESIGPYKNVSPMILLYRRRYRYPVPGDDRLWFANGRRRILQKTVRHCRATRVSAERSVQQCDFIVTEQTKIGKVERDVVEHEPRKDTMWKTRQSIRRNKHTQHRSLNFLLNF